MCGYAAKLRMSSDGRHAGEGRMRRERLKAAVKLSVVVLRLKVVALMLLICPLSMQAQITFFGTGGLTASSSGNLSVPLPASTAANDIILVHCYSRDTTDTTTITDYTEIAQFDTASASHRWFWKRHDGSEPNPTCTHDTASNQYGRAYVFRGVVTTGDPWNALGTPEAHGSEPMSVTGITTGAANSMVVLMDGYADNNTASVTTTATDPSTFTDSYEESTAGDDGSVHIAYAIRTAAGATGTITVNYSASFTGGDESGVLVLSLAPPAVAAQAPVSRRMIY
jgi:hypothetical protein